MRVLTGWFTIVLAGTLAGCSGTMPAAEPTTQPSGRIPPLPDSAVSSAEVVIDNFTFTPPTLVVAPGTLVRWTNHDDVPHTVTSTDKHFPNSGALDTDDTFSVAFPKTGTYPYYCAVHPHMTAVVVVK